VSGALDRFTEAAHALGVQPQVRRFPEGTKTAVDAANAIGCDVGQIVKSLVFGHDDEVVMALVSGGNQLDERALSELAGGGSVVRVDADRVRAATGYPIGGVPPFGHVEELATWIDEDLLAFDVVWAAAGTWNHVFAIAPPELVRASQGTVARLARR
jgi:prolyl-tRNA editing enzyme YbaK/EbsC (Cys-tRNA(Pro) deacylase)